MPAYMGAERSGGGGGEAEEEGEGGSVPGWGSAELETMIKPDRIRDCGAETGREANNKNRNSPGEETEVHPPLCEPDDRAVLRHARQDMRGVGGNFAPKLFSCSSVINWCILGFLLVLAVRFSLDGQETNSAPVYEMTKAAGAVEEELSSFTPKSPISEPYIPDELTDPTAYSAAVAAFKEAQVKYNAKLGKPQSLYSSQVRNLPLCVLS
jgi:hypothetical protein